MHKTLLMVVQGSTDMGTKSPATMHDVPPSSPESPVHAK